MEQEIWKSISGYDGLYQISNLAKIRTIGRIIILSTGRKLPIKRKIKVQINGKNGYKYVMLSKNSKSLGHSVHRLLAIEFIPNPNNYRCVNHKNGVKTDNRIENLEWCNHSLNNIHALDNKLRNTAGKLNRSDIKKIKELKNTGITNLEISYKTKFSEAIIQGVTSGTTYQKYIRD